jgi:hypothetical protein
VVFWIPVPFVVASALEGRARSREATPARAPAGAPRILLVGAPRILLVGAPRILLVGAPRILLVGAPRILLVGAAIAFAFYALLIYDSAGYAMSYVLPTAAWGILACGDLAVRLGPRRGALPCLALLAALLGVGALFPLDDYSLAAVRAHDARLRERFEAVNARFDPATTLLVTSTEKRRWSFRHVMYYLPEYTSLQLLRDPCFLPVTPEAPYLTAQGRRLRVSGPEGLDVARLAPPGAPGGIENVVYMVPGPAGRWVGESCAPYLERFETSGGEILHELRVSPALEVAVRDQRLECRSSALAAAPADAR